MHKACEVCGANFTTKEGRQKTCSKKCANISRSRNAVTPHGIRMPTVQPSQPVQPTYLKEDDLPDPAVLPAAYLKRCADYWNELVGGDVPVKRIA